jgi:hypothetical protein
MRRGSREAPAQAELRPTCPGPSRIVLPCGVIPSNLGRIILSTFFAFAAPMVQALLSVRRDRIMGGGVVRRGNPGSPGSGGASPYLPRKLPRHYPTKIEEQKHEHDRRPVALLVQSGFGGQDVTGKLADLPPSPTR